MTNVRSLKDTGTPSAIKPGPSLYLYVTDLPMRASVTGSIVHTSVLMGHAGPSART